MLKQKYLYPLLLVGALATSPLFVGCVAYGYADYGPPEEVVESYGVAPGPEFVWIGGHHVWAGRAYRWEAGRWARPPRRGARWEKGRWEKRQRGWRYTEGRWR